MDVTEALSETPLALDNDVFTWLRNENVKIQEKIRNHQAAGGGLPVLTSITVFEARLGYSKAFENKKLSSEQFEAKNGRIDDLVAQLRVLDFDSRSAGIAA